MTEKLQTIPHQPETEIYLGRNNHLVIKQEDPLDIEQMVLITPACLKAVISCLQERLKENNPSSFIKEYEVDDE